MAEVKDILDVIAPQFPDDAARNLYIELATERTNVCFYKGKTNQAIAYLTAHMMTLSDPNGAHSGGESGSVASKKEGDLSISFAPLGGGANAGNSGISPDLSQTHYGTQLAGLRKGSGMFMSVTGCPSTTPAILEGCDDC